MHSSNTPLLVLTLAACLALSACAPTQPFQQSQYPAPQGRPAYPHQPVYQGQPPIYQGNPRQQGYEPVPAPAKQSSNSYCNNGTNIAAGIAGAAVGGLVGSRFGKGNGKTAMAVVGAGGGALVGNSLGCQ